MSRAVRKNILLKIKIVQKRFNISLKSLHTCVAFSSADRIFQTRSAATEKAQSPSLSRVDGTTKSQQPNYIFLWYLIYELLRGHKIVHLFPFHLVIGVIFPVAVLNLPVIIRSFIGLYPRSDFCAKNPEPCRATPKRCLRVTSATEYSMSVNLLIFYTQ